MTDYVLKMCAKLLIMWIMLRLLNMITEILKLYESNLTLFQHLGVLNIYKFSIIKLLGL